MAKNNIKTMKSNSTYRYLTSYLYHKEKADELITMIKTNPSMKEKYETEYMVHRYICEDIEKSISETRETYGYICKKYFIEGKTIKEISEETRYKIGTVFNHIHMGVYQIVHKV